MKKVLQTSILVLVGLAIAIPVHAAETNDTASRARYLAPACYQDKKENRKNLRKYENNAEKFFRQRLKAAKELRKEKIAEADQNLQDARKSADKIFLESLKDSTTEEGRKKAISDYAKKRASMKFSHESAIELAQDFQDSVEQQVKDDKKIVASILRNACK